MSSTLAERLQNAMKLANMTQAELAAQTGASRAAISQYLSGKNVPNMDRIKALADATGVTFDYLIGYGTAPATQAPLKKISVKEAARCMGKSDQFVRIGLQRGFLLTGGRAYRGHRLSQGDQLRHPLPFQGWLCGGMETPQSPECASLSPSDYPDQQAELFSTGHKSRAYRRAGEIQ